MKFLSPVYGVLKFLATPLILSLYIFYALRPLKLFFNKYIKNETISATLSFLIFVLIVILLFGLLSSMFYTQISEIINRLVYNLNIDNMFNTNSEWMQSVQKYLDFKKFGDMLETKIQEWAQNIAKGLPSQVSSIFSGVGNFGTALLLSLLCIFYLLKDEDLLFQQLRKIAEGPYETELLNMGDKIHNTLRIYISGQLIVASILGGLMFIGFLIIKLPYALLMALIALVTNFIPFIGPFLGAAPAVLIAMTIDVSMVLKVIFVTVLVQQAESNLITPNIMGSKLDIHPFVVIVVVLVSMKLFGVIGALIATPLYLTIVAVIKTIQLIKYKKENLCPIPEDEK
ncbi:MAG: AI-2E family transporter [Tissierellia bacterium]|nr:AI-2E family transporter [Tissierellia bacterium]